MARRTPEKPANTRNRDDGSERVVGLSAAHAVLALRPRDVLNIAHSKDARAEVSELLREAARLRIAYREVDDSELERMAGSLHHEGICLRVRARPAVTPANVVTALSRGGFGVLLDGVENPHNVGALLRSAAYFGARAMLVRGAARLSAASTRVAEGGAEHVPVCFVSELGESLDALRKARVAIVAADAHGGDPLPQFVWPERALIVLGAERSGLSQATLTRRTHRVHIPGAGVLESLNVSVAAGILFSSAHDAHALKA
jgi:TrmH RNA methyltransferase